MSAINDFLSDTPAPKTPAAGSPPAAPLASPTFNKTPAPAPSSTPATKVPPAPVANTPAIDAFHAAPTPAPVKGGSAIESFLNTPTPPKTPPVAPEGAAPTESPYFQGYGKGGAFIGISDELDPYSGRPLFAYREPGDTSTTTDKSRTAPKINPEIAAPTDRDNFTNERMPESASQNIRKNLGATSDEQLDHAMALSVGGANTPKNLRLIPTAENQAAGKGEGALSAAVKNGAISLFDAQNQEAKNKGLPAPWTDSDVKRAGLLDTIKNAPDDSTLGIIKNTILGLPKATSDIVGTTGQTNPQGLKNLEQANTQVENLLNLLGPQADSLKKKQEELNLIKVDTSSQTSVDEYNSKVNSFNESLQAFNFKTEEGKKIAKLFDGAVQAYNDSIVAPSGVSGFLKGLADGIIEQYTKPSPLTQQLESQMKGPAILTTPTKAVLRTVEPMLEPIIHDVSAALIFNNPHLYEAFQENIKQNGLNPAGEELIGDTGKTPAQVVGDTAQAVLGAYMPELFGNSVKSFALKGVTQALLAAGTHGAVAGFTFGSAQAASSGSKDPKELAAIVLKNTIAGALLNVTSAGVAHGVFTTAPRAVDFIKSRLPKNMQEAQRGFVKNPFGVPTRTPASAEDAAKEYSEQVIKPSQTKGEPTIIGADDLKEHFGHDYNDENHGVYSKASYQLYQKALEENPDPSVILTGGGPGSGKTEGLINTIKGSGFKGTVYDSNMSSYEGAVRQIQDARAAGKEVSIYGITPDLDKARQHTVNREGVTGRGISDKTFARGHAQFPTVVSELIKNGIIEPEDVHILDTRNIHSIEDLKNSAKNGLFVKDPLAHMQSLGYDEDNVRETFTKDRYSPLGTESVPGNEGAGPGSEASNGHGANSENVGQRAGTETSGGINPEDVLVGMAQKSKSAHDFYLSLAPGEQHRVLAAIDPDGRGYTTEEAAHAYFAEAKNMPVVQDEEIVQPPVKKETPESGKQPGTQESAKEDKSQQQEPTPKERPRGRSEGNGEYRKSYNETITEHNGGVQPPVNKGGLSVPEIDWTTAKDKAAIRLSTDTMERNIEKIFPKETAEKINEYLVEPTRINETKKVQWANKVRTDTKALMDSLGIKRGSKENRLIQQFGEGRIDLDELKKASPEKWQAVVKASEHFRKVYDDALNKWNFNRAQAGMKPIGKLPNYFRHFVDLDSWVQQFGFNFAEGGLPTAISGITEFFKSQTPWASASMRRLGSTFTDDAIGGLDNFIDNTGRAIFHTDSVQRGRLLEKYLREAASAKPNDIRLSNFAANLNDWTNLVSGKQARLDRAIESVVGRPALAAMRKVSRLFGANVIAGNVSAAFTHAIPAVYTLATTDKGASFRGLTDTLHSPFMEDPNSVAGQQSKFLTRRFGVEEIARTKLESIEHGLSTPFRTVDKFISRFAVSGKYFEELGKGKTPTEAMRAADNYANRVIGDRSAGNLPNLMNTKTLGWITQFQIEVNDNLRVLLHDIPRWEKGNAAKIANRYVQFAIYSWLFNQSMQYIKGSGKGLDPIDLGMTLAGLNDEGGGKSVMQRLAVFGQDLAKELPFASVPTSGQIPALQPLFDAGSDLSKGNFAKAAQGFGASFASPIGGGAQAQKTLTAIQAWRQGYVTDSNGKITAVIPQTIPTLAQGILFGKSAFESVKKSKEEMSNLSATISQGQQAAKLKDTQARNILTQLKGMSAENAKAQLLEISQTDPDMAKRVLAAAKDNAAGITKQDSMLKSLGVANGARAKYIVSQLKEMNTEEEKKDYLVDLANKKILTASVLKEVTAGMKE